MPRAPGEKSRTTRIATWVTLALVAFVGIEIGLATTQSPRPRALGPSQLLDESLRAAGGSDAFHYRSVWRADGVSQIVVGDARPASGSESVSVGDDQFTVVSTDQAVYFRGVAAALRDQLGLPATTASADAGKWISLLPSDGPYPSLEEGCHHFGRFGAGLDRSVRPVGGAQDSRRASGPHHGTNPSRPGRDGLGATRPVGALEAPRGVLRPRVRRRAVVVEHHCLLPVGRAQCHQGPGRGGTVLDAAKQGGLMDREYADAIARLIDKDQIIDLVHEYSYCVDHELYDDVVELFTEDCTVDYGSAPPVHSRASLRRMFEHSGGGFAATSHHNANVLVSFDDVDHASVRTSVYAWHKRSDGGAPQLWGYYHDTVVHRPEGWRIANRKLTVLGVHDWDAEWHPAVDVVGE